MSTLSALCSRPDNSKKKKKKGKIYFVEPVFCKIAMFTSLLRRYDTQIDMIMTQIRIAKLDSGLKTNWQHRNTGKLKCRNVSKLILDFFIKNIIRLLS